MTELESLQNACGKTTKRIITGPTLVPATTIVSGLLLYRSSLPSQQAILVGDWSTGHLHEFRRDPRTNGIGKQHAKLFDPNALGAFSSTTVDESAPIVQDPNQQLESITTCVTVSTPPHPISIHL